MRRARMDHEAVSQTFGSLVALTVFLGFFGALIIATSEPSTSNVKDTQNRLEAERIADLLAGSPGVGWDTGADNLARLGLVDPATHQINLAHLEALRGASYQANANNGKVDYEEALASLGLPTDGSLGFHLRMTPVGLQQRLQTASLAHIDTALIADWENTPRTFTVTQSTDQTMVNDARAQVDATISSLTQHERDTIASLGVGYDDNVNLWGFTITAVHPITGASTPLADAMSDPSLLDGDLYIDDKQYLAFQQASSKGLLEDQLPAYEVLIIGSTAAQSSLTSNNVKQPIADWVIAGGTLMILGSSSQNYQWLQPLFSVGTTTVNAAPAAPDVSHPMLHEPYELDWPNYEHFGIGWDLKQNGAHASYEQFQHVITSGNKDLLAVSNEGAFGAGRVFLTAYRPEDIFIDQGAPEAHNFLNNLVIFGDRSYLYLDYGPTPPDNAIVSAAVRTTQILDPNLGMINIRLTILYWGT